MSRSKFFRVIFIPILVGLIVTSVIYALTGSKAATPKDKIETIDVVMTTKAIPARTTLSKEQLVLRKVPKELVNNETITSLSDAVGKVTVLPLAAGEIVLRSKLATSNKTSLAYRIPEGYRAITIKDNEIIGVGGFPEPGDYVDVLSTLPKEIGGGVDRTRLILEEVLVLAVGRDLQPEGKKDSKDLKGPSSITLAVTPEQAAVLTLAEERGSLRLLLRPATGDRRYGDVNVTSKVFAETTPIKEAYSPKTQVKIQVYLAEVDRKSLPALVTHPQEGITFSETPLSGMNVLQSLVQGGKAKVIHQAELITMNKQQTGLSLAGNLLVENKDGISRWEDYGITLSVTPTVYDRPYIDLELRPQLKILDTSPQPFTSVRESQGTVRIDQKEMTVVSGLLKPDDFNGRQRYVLPEQYISQELKNGDRDLVLLIVPQIDRR